jgi:hypothetical protein
MRKRGSAAIALAALLALQPVTPVRAAESDGGDESRVGVVLMVVCGMALKASTVAPVPWAGIAFVSCLMGFVDAGLSPDPGSPNAP